MAKSSLEERNKKIREKMLNFTEITLHPLPNDSLWLKPKRLTYVQNGKKQSCLLMSGLDSVVILIFNVSRKKFILVKQFRPASYLNNVPLDTTNVDLKMYPPSLGITLELCAGTVDKSKPIVEIAQAELKEECGYEAPLSAFQKIQTYRYLNIANHF